MATNDTGSGGPFDRTSSREQREIGDDIIDEIDYVGDVQRNRNSIYTSSKFHLDAKPVSGGYKVEIQRRSGNKRTVSCVVVEDSCGSVDDVKAALRGSLGSSSVWHAT